MQSKATTVDGYLAELPAARRSALDTLRHLILTTVPVAEEKMMYGMPAYRIGNVVCGLASQKHHMAFYCCEDVVEKYRSRLGKLDCGKGCIRFRQLEELPLAVVSSILKDVSALTKKPTK